ncbi:MAG TPA: hypothetical protein VHJ38_08760 [Nitrososphaeraceae archaeon]|nr:hypothetical protein [Nitrososphaeraceae archaeon]
MPKVKTLYSPSNMTSLVSKLAREIPPLGVPFPNSEYRFILFIYTIPTGPCAFFSLQKSTDSTKNLQTV